MILEDGNSRNRSDTQTRRRPEASPRKTNRRRSLALEKLENRILLFSNRYSGAPNHENITTAALQDIVRPDVLQAIIGGFGSGLHFINTSTGNVGVDIRDNYLGSLTPGYDPKHHFDSSYFNEGASYINGNYNSIIAEVTDNTQLTSTTSGGVADLFGQITHTEQDFYAHSNWVNTLGGGVLVDDGNGLWNALTPYSIVDGVVMVEGTVNPSPSNPIGNIIGLTTDANYQSPDNPDFRVTVHFANGSTMPGIVSGTYLASKNHVPSAVAVGHDDSIQYEIESDMLGDAVYVPVTTATGLNKDESGRIDFDQAYSTAIQQTEHEFYRLLHLVLDQKGMEAVDELICDWVLPDQEDMVKQMIGIDTTGDMDGKPITIDSASPVNIPLGDCVQAGDTIVVSANFTTNDPNENGEGEPVILQMSGGTTPDGKSVKGQKVTIDTYGQQRDIMLIAQVDNETLSAYDVGADGDEMVTVSAKDTSATQDNFDQSQNDDLADNSTQMNLDASLLASAVQDSGGISSPVVPTAVTITSTSTGNVVTVGSPATTSSAASAGYEVLAALDWRESTSLNALTLPQADAMDGTVPAPMPVAFSLLASGADIKVVAAFNTLYGNIDQIIGLSDALHSALDRALNARTLGHTSSLIVEEAAARDYSSQLASLLNQQPMFRAQLQASLKAAGTTQSVSTSQVSNFEQGVQSNGLPATISKLLGLSGASSSTINTITTLAIAQDPSLVAGTLPDKIADSSQTALFSNAATALQSLAAPDLAVSIAQIGDVSEQGITSASLILGGTVTYNVTVTNNSLLAVSGAVLDDTFEKSLSDVLWSTSSSNASSVPDLGNGDIHAVLTLQAGGRITFTVTATLSSQPNGALIDTASVSLPTGLSDANPSDNTATSTLSVSSNPALKPLQVSPITAQTVKVGGSLTFRPHVVDPNIPSGQITFSLDPGAPAGASIDPLTGVFTFKPMAGAMTAMVTIRATPFGVSTLSSAVTFPIVVASSVSPPMVTLSPAEAVSTGSTFSDTGSFVSTASGPFTATVDYGDGTGLQALLVSPSRTFTLNHIYVSPGAYTLTVGVEDQAGLIGRAALNVNVSASAPRVTLSPAGAVSTGSTFSDAGSFVSTASGPFTATVDYGDGSPIQPLALNSDQTFDLSHIFATAGSYVVTVKVADPSGLTGTSALTVSVTAPVISVTTTTSVPQPAGFGADRDAFVTTIYQEILGHLPTTVGLDYWAGLLALGVKPKTIALDIWNSKERRNLARKHLAPKISFSHAYADATKAGRQAAEALITSPSVPKPTGFGPDRDAFVTTIYREELGRLPEANDLKYWSGLLALNVNPETVASDIGNSKEHRNLVRERLAPKISLSRAYADATQAGRQAAKALIASLSASENETS